MHASEKTQRYHQVSLVGICYHSTSSYSNQVAHFLAWAAVAISPNPHLMDVVLDALWQMSCGYDPSMSLCAVNAEEDDEPISPRWRVLRGHITTNSIPWLLAGSDIIIGLASGMTLKFVPIFLLQACDLDPITVNIYTFISPLLIAAIMFSLPPIAKTLGMLVPICSPSRIFSVKSAQVFASRHPISIHCFFLPACIMESVAVSVSLVAVAAADRSPHVATTAQCQTPGCAALLRPVRQRHVTSPICFFEAQLDI